MKLREILVDKSNITPEILLEYVIDKISESEADLACDDLIDTFISLVEYDNLSYSIHEMYDEYNFKSRIKKYDINKPSKYEVLLNHYQNNERLKEYCKNIRLLIKEALNKINKINNKNKIFTKKEALKFLDIISNINNIDLGYYFFGTVTSDGNFITTKYIQMFGHPAIYRIKEEDRKYVIEKLTEDAKQILEECNFENEEITQEEINEYVNSKLKQIEDTRTYPGSEIIFWDWDYSIIDSLGVNNTLTFFNKIGENYYI